MGAKFIQIDAAMVDLIMSIGMPAVLMSLVRGQHLEPVIADAAVFS